MIATLDGTTGIATPGARSKIVASWSSGRTGDAHPTRRAKGWTDESLREMQASTSEVSRSSIAVPTTTMATMATTEITGGIILGTAAVGTTLGRVEMADRVSAGTETVAGVAMDGVAWIGMADSVTEA